VGFICLIFLEKRDQIKIGSDASRYLGVNAIGDDGGARVDADSGEQAAAEAQREGLGQGSHRGQLRRGLGERDGADDGEGVGVIKCSSSDLNCNSGGGNRGVQESGEGSRLLSPRYSAADPPWALAAGPLRWG
jgi:hypothetical protein